MYCPGGNVTDPIWRVLASSYGISSWTPLKSQLSNLKHNPNALANQLWCIDFLIPLTPIIPHRLMLDLCKMVEKQFDVFHTLLWHYSKFKTEFYCISVLLKSPHIQNCIFEIHQLWQSGFIRVYSNPWCSCFFEPENIKISQSSRKMYSNNILNF